MGISIVRELGPVLTILADFLGILGGLIISVKELDRTSDYYIRDVITALSFQGVRGPLKPESAGVES